MRESRRGLSIDSTATREKNPITIHTDLISEHVDQDYLPMLEINDSQAPRDGLPDSNVGIGKELSNSLLEMPATVVQIEKLVNAVKINLETNNLTYQEVVRLSDPKYLDLLLSQLRAHAMADNELITNSMSLESRIHFATGFCNLGRRQRTVMMLYSSGKGRQEVADAMGITLKTVVSHIEKVFGQLGVNSQADLIRFAFATNIFSLQTVQIEQIHENIQKMKRSFRSTQAKQDHQTDPLTYQHPTQLSETEKAAFRLEFARFNPIRQRIALKVAGGYSNKEIGYELSMPKSTVNGHINAILSALGLDRKERLIQYAYISGLFT